MPEITEPSAVAALFAAHRASTTRPLPPSALKVVRFIEQNPGLAITGSAADLARRLGLSDATVIRAVQALGFDGMADLRRAVAAALEGSSPAARMRRTLRNAEANAVPAPGMPVGDAPGRAIDLALEMHQAALSALRSAAAREAMLAAMNLLGAAGRIVVFGIGPSGMLARYASLLLARVGRDAHCLDASGIGLADQLLGLNSGDALLVLAYGRAYGEVTATIAEAVRKHLPIVLVTDGLAARLAARADVIVPVQRGGADRVALHGATLVLLEALVLGLAAIDRERVLETLDRLNALRAAVVGEQSARS